MLIPKVMPQIAKEFLLLLMGGSKGTSRSLAFSTVDNADEMTTGSWLFSWRKAYSRCSGPSFLVSLSVGSSDVDRGRAGKGGSWVLTPDLVVMAKVGASGPLFEHKVGELLFKLTFKNLFRAIFSFFLYVCCFPRGENVHVRFWEAGGLTPVLLEVDTSPSKRRQKLDAVVVGDFYKKFYNSLGRVPNRYSSSIGKTRGLLSFSRGIGWEGLIMVKEKQGKDKIGTKPDKNGKRGKARQCRRPITVEKAEKGRKYKV
nr:hypothetical protein [Tanacetum cinerariifolium]